MAQMLEWSIGSHGGLAAVDLDDLERWLNETAFKAIDYDQPIKRLQWLLSSQHRP